MSTLTASPEVPIRVITPADVRASINRARRSLEKAAEEIVWQIEMEGWRTLGYSSWGAMREAEYGGAAFMVPSKSRPEIVARIKEIEIGRTARGTPKHLTDQEVADTAGVSRSQVQDDLNGNNKKSSSGQNVTPATEPDEDVIDAEIVEDDEPAYVNYETGEVLDAPPKSTRSGITNWSATIQNISATIPMEDLTEDEVLELRGAVEFLHNYIKGELITRNRMNP